MSMLLVIICSLALVALVIKLADKGITEKDSDSEALSMYVYIGGAILLGLIIMVTSYIVRLITCRSEVQIFLLYKLIKCYASEITA